MIGRLGQMSGVIGSSGNVQARRLETPGGAPDVGVDQVTVVIPAHSTKRWLGLIAAVESVLEQSPGAAQVVVSVDHNLELEERARQELSGATVVSNRFGRGASGARNSGVLVATTPLVAFLDSDARAGAGWLTRLVAPFRDSQVIGTGGTVAPHWQVTPPPWFPEEFSWVVGASFIGQATGQAKVRNVWSENMAVRRDVFLSVGGFNLDFGKVGDSSRPEDTDLCLRMGAIQPGRHWLYVPDAIVFHAVPRERSRFSFFLRRCFSEGRGKVELARRNAGPSVLGDEIHYLSDTVPRGIGRNLVGAALGRDVWSLARAGAMVAGIGAAGLGAIAAQYGRLSAR